MRLEGAFTFEGSREEVWDAILDPKVLATALPGTQKMEKTGEDEYEAVMQIRVGPVSGVFNGKVVLKDKEFPHRYTMIVEGKGSAGFARGTSKVEFIAQKDGTLMKYEAEIEVGGRIANVGQRLLDTVGKSICRQSLNAINETLQKRLAAGGKDIEYAAPSQRRFVLNIMKDVGRSHIALAIGAAILFILIVGLLIALILGHF